MVAAVDVVALAVAARAARAATDAAPSRSSDVLVPSTVQVRPPQEVEEVGRTQVVMSEAVTSPALTLPPPTSSLHPYPPPIASPRSTLRFAHLSCLARVQC